MCLAIPGKITKLEDSTPFAVVDVTGVRRRVNVELLADETLVEGDWVLIHVGFAMSKISAEQAEEQIRLLRMLGEDRAAMEEWSAYRFGREP